MNHECLHWNAEQWLAQVHRPTPVPGLPESRVLYRKLLSRWHPDRNPSIHAGAVFHHLRELFDTPLASAERLVARDGRRFDLRIRQWHPQECGRVGWGEHCVVWRFPAVHRDRWHEGWCQVQGGFADEGMRQQFQPGLPTGRLVDTEDEVIWVQPRTQETRSLAELLPETGLWPLAHMAWLVSGLLNWACYLDYRRVAFLGWSPAGIMVDTTRHAVKLWGGWWYASPFTQRPWGMPRSTWDAQSEAWRQTPLAETGLDVRAIQALVRPWLDASSTSHAWRWLAQPWAGTAVAAYGSWRQAVQRDLGPPRFTPFPVSGTFKETSHG